MTAPMMVDAAGCATDKVKLSYDSSSKTVTIKPDRKWLESEAREYPVRIDPETTLVTPSQKVSYDYDVLNSLGEKAYEDGEGNAVNEGVVYGYDVLGRRVSMMDRSGDSSYEYDGLGRITKVTTGSGEVTTYAYDGCDQLESITYPDGKSVRYEYDKNDNLTKVTDRTGAVTTYVYDAINRVTEIHRPNGVNTYNTYNARDQIVSMVNRCDECGWIVSRYDYTYDDRGFIVAEDAVESLYAYAWDDKHDGKHESWHDDLFPHGNKHINKHDKDGIYNFQIIETKRAFTYDDDGRLLTAAENEDRQGRYDYVFKYDDMGNRIFYSKARNGSVQESAEYTYNASNQMVKVREYDGKHYRNVEYTYDTDGNRILEEEVKPDGNRKVEKSYEYSVENRLKAVRDAHDLLVAMAYDGDGNRIFQLNYNLHTDDDWKGNSGNGNGNNKDKTGSGNNGNGNGNKKSAAAAIAEFFTGEEPEAGKLGAGVSQALAERLFSEEILGGLAEGLGIPEETVTAQEETGTDSSDTANADYGQTMTATPGNAAPGAVSPGNAAASYAGKNDNGNNGNGGNVNHCGWGNGNNGNGNGNSGNENGNSGNGNGNSSTGGTNDNNGNASGNTNNTGGSQNQSGILFPVAGEVSELEQELIDMIKTTGKQKNYELVEHVNDVNRDHVEVLMELNINGIMDTAYSYGNERLTNERFTGWTGYYTYDPRGSVTGVTGSDGYIWQSYRYNAYGDITFGKPQYNNVYSYNAESFNPNIDAQYLRSRYYSVKTAGFISEDSYLGNITDPLTLNRYNYVKSSPLNYVDPSGNWPGTYYGFQVERKTVLARMQEMGIQAIYPRQSTSRRDPSHKVYPHLLKDVSAAYPDHVWSIDITYIPIQKSWLYLTAIIDWYSRYVLAWEINDTLEIPFVLDACRRALERSQPVIMNNDQGSHFTSPKYTRLFQETGCLISMDHRGRAYDNIFIERFWRSLKYEDIYLKDYQYPREARKGIYQYLEYYNNERLHQSLGYRTPASLYYGSK